VAAPEDAALLTQWETHLQPLRQAALISIWSEIHLAPGADRAVEIERQFATADVVLLLLSPDFFASPDCLELMEQALQQSHAATTRVIPILLRSVAWQESPLAALTPWPSNKKPIMLWSDQDEGWLACVQEIRRLLGRRVTEELSSERPSKPAELDRERMLRRLRRSYKELLNQSLHGIDWVELGLAAQPDAVRNVTNLRL